jgi:3',5'-cyclic AMP phosphodiesterase CpdA
MRITVISDIHGNATAFEAVLADIEKQGPMDAVYCLGDNVGYGPEPEKVMRLLREHGIPSVLGNHELAIIQPETLSWFNPTARRSIEKTAALLSDEAKACMAKFPTHLSSHGCRFVHGFPPDSVTTYLFEIDAVNIRQTLDLLSETIVFIGQRSKQRAPLQGKGPAQPGLPVPDQYRQRGPAKGRHQSGQIRDLRRRRA